MKQKHEAEIQKEIKEVTKDLRMLKQNKLAPQSDIDACTEDLLRLKEASSLLVEKKEPRTLYDDWLIYSKKHYKFMDVVFKEKTWKNYV